MLTALAVVLGLRAAVGWGHELVAYRASAAVKSALRLRLLERAATLGPRWAAEARSGEVVALATTGLDALDAYFARCLPQLGLAVIVPPAVVACLAAVDPIAALTVGLTVPLIPLFMILVGRATESRRQRRWRAMSRLATYFLDVVAGLPTLRVFGRSQGQLSALRRVTDDYRRETLATLRVAFLSAFVLELAATLSVALVAVGIGLRLVAGELDLTRGLFALILAPEAYLPLRALGAQFHASEEGLGAAARAFEIIEAQRALAGGELPRPLGGGRLLVREVSVVQPGRAEIAPDGVSFEALPGSIVALAGPSGCGKSTVLAVLLGLLPADGGDVRLVAADGTSQPLESLDLEAWRQRVAWLPQEPFFVPGTVVENVRLVAPSASDRRIAAALARLGLAELAPTQRLGEQGRGVSSGQRRRLAVARTLLRDASLVLLDEPTAGLDEAAEALVLAAIRDAARGGAAVVLVAHRPAALAIADRVVTVSRPDGEAVA